MQEKSHNKTAATKTGRRLASTDAWPEPFKKTEKKRFDKKKESPSCELEASAAQSTSIRPGAEVDDGNEAADACAQGAVAAIGVGDDKLQEWRKLLSLNKLVVDRV